MTFTSDSNFGSLNDGRYTLVVNADQVLGTGNTPMAANSSMGFHRFFGDSSGDARLDIQDFGPFSSSYLTQQGQPGFQPSFDFNSDNHIDVQDFGQFSIRYFTSLP